MESPSVGRMGNLYKWGNWLEFTVNGNLCEKNKWNVIVFLGDMLMSEINANSIDLRKTRGLEYTNGCSVELNELSVMETSDRIVSSTNLKIRLYMQHSFTSFEPLHLMRQAHYLT